MAHDPIRVFVGTDQRQSVAERALENSIRANTTRDVEIVWMRAGDPGWTWSKRGWGTEFSCFRLAIPELCQFKGRAIYLDVDMIVIGDIGELFDQDIPPGFDCLCRPGRLDVILWDCESVGHNRHWPSLAQIKASPQGLHNYKRKIRLAENLSPHWDCCEGHGMSDQTKLIHFTGQHIQPWKPHPERWPYDKEHPNPAAVDLFWRYANLLCTSPASD